MRRERGREGEKERYREVERERGREGGEESAERVKTNLKLTESSSPSCEPVASVR